VTIVIPHKGAEQPPSVAVVGGEPVGRFRGGRGAESSGLFAAERETLPVFESDA
jgi:hypothetical protein